MQVDKAKQEFKVGNLFEVVLSQTFKEPCTSRCVFRECCCVLCCYVNVTNSFFFLFGFVWFRLVSLCSVLFCFVLFWVLSCIECLPVIVATCGLFLSLGLLLLLSSSVSC